MKLKTCIAVRSNHSCATLGPQSHSSRGAWMENTGWVRTTCFDCSTTTFLCFFSFYKSQIFFKTCRNLCRSKSQKWSKEVDSYEYFASVAKWMLLLTPFAMRTSSNQWVLPLCPAAFFLPWKRHMLREHFQDEAQAKVHWARGWIQVKSSNR